MKQIKLCILLLFSGLLMSSCALKKPITVRNAPIETYHYAYIPPTQQLTSGGTYGGQYGVYGVTKSVNSADIMAGALIKQGFVILPEVKQELAAETLIVNFSQSGRRNIWGGLWGYTLEVTIQFISAQTHQVICTCTAEGLGDTEADDIRQAITRALDDLFNKTK